MKKNCLFPIPMGSKWLVLLLAISLQLFMLFNTGTKARVFKGDHLHVSRNIDIKIDETVMKTFENNGAVVDPLENPPRPPESHGPPGQINPVPPPKFLFSQTYVEDSD
ncbi:hypothetical protein SCA6_018290 [Theobroma cacao]